MLGATCLTSSDAALFGEVAGSFKAHPPLVFAMHASSDCTVQLTNLPMLGLEGMAHITRSSWHVMASLPVLLMGVGSPLPDNGRWHANVALAEVRRHPS